MSPECATALGQEPVDYYPEEPFPDDYEYPEYPTPTPLPEVTDYPDYPEPTPTPTPLPPVTDYPDYPEPTPVRPASSPPRLLPMTRPTADAASSCHRLSRLLPPCESLFFLLRSC